MECPHKYDKCYKAVVNCFTDSVNTKDVHFRGCGGYATIGERHIINIITVPGSKYR